MAVANGEIYLQSSSYHLPEYINLFNFLGRSAIERTHSIYCVLDLALFQYESASI